MPAFNVSIAGVAIRLELPGASWVESLQPRFGKFHVADGTHVELVCRLVVDAREELSPDGQPRVEQDIDGLHLRHDNFDAHLPPTGNATLTIFQRQPDPVDATYVMVTDSFLRMALAQLLAARGGLMLHAAGIATSPEAGFVFFGPSGSGKTTVCRLSSPRFRVLCDEIVAIRPTDVGEGYRLYGTPFNGAWGDSLAEDVPLRELFYLRQAAETRRVPLDDMAAARALLESAVAYHQDPAFIGSFLDVALALIRRVPVTQLDFIAKETLWETVLAPTR